MKPFGFPKSERLCSKKSIDKLFASGKNLFHYPVKALFFIENNTPPESPLQVLFVVPKKRFKRAVKRNRIRRQMREAFRLNKQQLVDWCQINGLEIRVAFIYVSSDMVDYPTISNAIQYILKAIPNSQANTKQQP
jgi:ribonuclease P protein component